MDIIFAEARYAGRVKLGRNAELLPRTVGLITTVQFAGALEEVKKEIEKTGRKALLSRGKQKYPGQVLGCESSAASKIADKVDAFLYIGTGEFHPVNVALETGKEVYVLAPDGKLGKLCAKEIEQIKNRKRGALMKFLNAEKIGILATTKSGQSRLKKALELKEKLEKQNKKAYVFIDNTLDFSKLQDFNFIQAWVNTACPRIAEDFPCVNINEI